MSRALYKIKSMICDELKTISEQGELTADTLDTVDKLTHSLKSIESVEDMEERGYSQDMYRRSRRYDDTPDRGYYSRYSRDTGNRTVDKLRAMMEDAVNEKDRAAIKACISQMEG